MSTFFIFHGTEGYPEENWFPWLKKKLEEKGHTVRVPQFPSPPVVPAKIAEWFDVLKKYESEIDEETILIGHSLGGIFTLHILERLKNPVRAAYFVGTPVGMRPILNFDRDNAFSGFTFDWESIRTKADRFTVFQSDNDPYVGPENGKTLAKNLGVTMTMIPGAGHFNTAAGYTEFPKLLEMIETE